MRVHAHSTLVIMCCACASLTPDGGRAVSEIDRNPADCNTIVTIQSSSYFRQRDDSGLGCCTRQSTALLLAFKWHGSQHVLHHAFPQVNLGRHVMLLFHALDHALAPAEGQASQLVLQASSAL
jgi:hypothetical protein